MTRHSKLAWPFLLVCAVFAACSFDSRTLMVRGGAGGGSSGSVGAAGAVSSAGTDVVPQGGAPGLGAGEKCAAAADCNSNTCLDGVCCAGTCDGICMSCAKAVTGKSDGVCGQVQAGMDPHDDCAQGKSLCGLDGQCDGAGACRFAVPSTMCAAEACQADQYTPAAQCDGAGQCGSPAPVSCGGHPCVATRCDIPCKNQADCPATLYCDGTTCQPQKTDGSACTADAECGNAHCSADKICCDKPCDTKCNSCKQASTGQTDGKCAPVQAGMSHGTDCPGTAKCNAGGTAVTPAPACDGAGACATPGDVSCGSYSCNSAKASCNAACTVDTDCASSAYCAAKLCKAKNAPGALCTANNQCQSADCEGRCCKTGVACMCPQPSAGNLITNPGFDKDLSGWTVEAGAATIIWEPGTYKSANGSFADANGCAYSGAAYISNSDPNNSSQNITQCVAISPQTDYDFGGQFATLSGAFTHCVLDVYTGPSCTGSMTNVADVQWINVGWSSPDFPTEFNSNFATTAKVHCYVEAGGSFFLDDLYLIPKPGLY